MKQLLRWFLILLLSFMLVMLGGVVFAKVVIPYTSWIWYRELPDGASRIHGRALVFIVGLLFFGLAAVLAGVTRLVDWALFPTGKPVKK